MSKQNNNIEIWKDVVGLDGLFMVSNLGNMKTMPKQVFHNLTLQFITRKERMLRNNSLNTSGYLQVLLHKNGAKIAARVHRLVAEAFIPNPLNKPCVNHINGIKTDNRVSNLEWCTFSENCQHAVMIGLKRRGHERVDATIKSEEIVKDIRRIYQKETISQRKLAAQFGMSKSSIQLLLANKTYKDYSISK